MTNGTHVESRSCICMAADTHTHITQRDNESVLLLPPQPTFLFLDLLTSRNNNSATVTHYRSAVNFAGHWFKAIISSSLNMA